MSREKRSIEHNLERRELMVWERALYVRVLSDAMALAKRNAKIIGLSFLRLPGSISQILGKLKIRKELSNIFFKARM